MKITDLKFDKNNYNKGTEIGDKLLEKSITKFGFIQPAVIDKNGNIVAGNKRIAKAGELGIDDVQVIKGNPNMVTVIQYDDFDLENDDMTKEYALADNQIAVKNIMIDSEMVVEDLGVEIAEEWVVEHLQFDGVNKEINLADDISQGIISFSFDHKQYLNVLDQLKNAEEKLQCNSKEETLLKLLEGF